MFPSSDYRITRVTGFRAVARARQWSSTHCGAGTVGRSSKPRRTVKPGLTFGRAMRMLSARWWVVLICIVLVTVLGVSLANKRLSSATASARVHEQDTSVAFSPQSGLPQPSTESRSVNELTRGDFVDPQIAAAAAAKLGGGMTGSGLSGALGFTPLNGTDVELTYSGGGSTAEAGRRLKAYVNELISTRIATQRQQLAARGHETERSGWTAGDCGRNPAAGGRQRPRPADLPGRLDHGLQVTIDPFERDRGRQRRGWTDPRDPGRARTRAVRPPHPQRRRPQACRTARSGGRPRRCRVDRDVADGGRGRWPGRDRRRRRRGAVTAARRRSAANWRRRSPPPGAQPPCSPTRACPGRGMAMRSGRRSRPSRARCDRCRGCAPRSPMDASAT